MLNVLDEFTHECLERISRAAFTPTLDNVASDVHRRWLRGDQGRSSPSRMMKLPVGSSGHRDYSRLSCAAGEMPGGLPFAS
jgi:hypothetical protein